MKAEDVMTGWYSGKKVTGVGGNARNGCSDPGYTGTEYNVVALKHPVFGRILY